MATNQTEYIEVRDLTDPVTINGVTQQAEKWIRFGVLRIAKSSSEPKFWLVRPGQH